MVRVQPRDNAVSCNHMSTIPRHASPFLGSPTKDNGHPRLGLVPKGTGGGALNPAGFFGGGGGGGFRLLSAVASEGGGTTGGCSVAGDACFSRKSLTLPVTLNFLFQELTFWALAEICS